MSVLLSTVGLVLFVVVFTMFAADLFRRRHDLLSWRNLFLLGFAHFCCLSSFFAATMYNQFVQLYTPSDASMLKLAVALPLFLVLFLACNSVTRNRAWSAQILPPMRLPTSFAALSISIASLLAASVAFAVLKPESFLGLMAVQFRSGLAVTAVGLATYLLISSRLNPLSWLIFGGAFILATLTSITGEGGRRGLLGVLIALPWMWYFIDLRYRPARAALVRVGAMAVLGTVLVAAYSGIRRGDATGEGRYYDFGTRVRQMAHFIQNPYIDTKNALMMLYTDTGMNMLFIMDNYPSLYPYQPAQGLLFFLSNPIPRMVWPEKPIAFGIILQEQMESPANLGPGILGHGWAEAGWFGVAAYACFFGLLTGAVDRGLIDRARNPYFIAVMAAGGGNVLALPRGETSLFLLQISAAIASSIACLYLVRILTGGLMYAGAELSPPMLRKFDEEHHYDEYESSAA